MEHKKTALIAGATGVVGRNLIRHLLAEGDWNIIAISRRKPDIEGDFVHHSLDLMNPDACLAAKDQFAGVTQVFFAAYIERPTWAEMVEPNVAMLRNLLQAVEAGASALEHVHVMHGTKWYGSHLGSFKTPAEENDPPHMPPNFYFDQLHLVETMSEGKAWSWSTARPHCICGFAIGNPMNLVMVISVYATISKVLGLPLRHPGNQRNSETLFNVTDSALLSRACTWMSTEPKCANQSFNVTNGDFFRWQDLWPVVADYFDMAVDRPQKIQLSQMMSDKADLWSELVEQHQLVDIPFDDLVKWQYGDFVFTPEYDVMSSTTKLRKFGFGDFIDTKQMFLRQFDELREAKIIPTV